MQDPEEITFTKFERQLMRALLEARQNDQWTPACPSMEVLVETAIEHVNQVTATDSAIEYRELIDKHLVVCGYCKPEFEKLMEIIRVTHKKE